MAIKTAPVETNVPLKPKEPRKATKKPVEPVPEVSEPHTTPDQEKAAGEAPKGKKGSGFASMTPDRHKALSAKGGANQPKEKRYFSRDPMGARAAAKLGGTVSRKGNKNAEI
jgi:general stress protein YciG